jgi:Predicted metal-binding integral membrane protein (DUF2182)
VVVVTQLRDWTSRNAWLPCQPSKVLLGVSALLFAASVAVTIVWCGTAWRYGLRLGIHCSHCCAGLMAILLVIGVMDLRAMALVAEAINVERLAPAGERVARAVGVIVVGMGLVLIARSFGRN